MCELMEMIDVFEADGPLLTLALGNINALGRLTKVPATSGFDPMTLKILAEDCDMRSKQDNRADTCLHKW